jgi:MoaA/NifB/PqqE/SkfB family radical SAM enzyme
MKPFLTETLMITSRCSAGCLPCPFANGTVEQRFLSVHRTLEKIRCSEAPLVVISGGEPFEHPHFAQLVHSLAKGHARGKPFRIATGGHRPMAEYLPQLKAIEGFQGISLGTDVLSRICSNTKAYAHVWHENVRRLNEMQVPYSLTLTLHAAMTDAREVLKIAHRCGAQPEFVYLRVVSKNISAHECCTAVKALWPSVVVIFDELV